MSLCPGSFISSRTWKVGHSLPLFYSPLIWELVTPSYMPWIFRFSLVMSPVTMEIRTFLNMLFPSAEMVCFSVYSCAQLCSARWPLCWVQTATRVDTPNPNCLRSISHCVSCPWCQVEYLNQKSRLHHVCIWEINQSFPSVLFEEFKEPY